MRIWRRLVGGHWERWYVGDGLYRVWIQVPECSKVTGSRPGPDCLGTPDCEDYR